MSLPLLSPPQMAEMDRRTIEQLGVPGLVLMEAAAGACVQALLTRWSEEARDGVIVLAGPGNNGADGLAMARRLCSLGVAVQVHLALPEATPSPDCARQLALARAFGVPVLEAAPALESFGVVVDGLFGTGLSRPLTGGLSDLAGSANRSGRPILAIDIPSGVHGGTGQILGAAIQADLTVTFAAAKVGHFTEPGRSLRGDLHIADIGVPVRRFDDLLGSAPRLLDHGCLAPLRGPVDRAAHKGTFGHLLVVAGGPGKVGAARLTCEAALRAGAGLVTLALPESTPLDALASMAPEVMLERVPGVGGAFGGASVGPVFALARRRAAVAVGPGLGSAPETQAFVQELLGSLPGPVVVDADGLNAMVGQPWPASDGRVVTPHPGEAARLLSRSTADVQADRLGSARRLAADTGSVAVLKGAGTLVADQDSVALNPSGNPGMGTAGSGDVLTGVIGALLSRGLPAADAATMGVFWHGLAGDRAAAERGEAGVIASDISAALGPVLADRPPSPPWAPWLATSRGFTP